MMMMTILMMMLILLLLLIVAVMVARVQRQLQRRHERLAAHDARDGRRCDGGAAGSGVGCGYSGCGDGGGVMLLAVRVEFVLGLHRFAAHDAHVPLHDLQP